MNRVAVFLPNWLGDVVMSTPAIRALSRRFPDARITAVGTTAACDTVLGLPYIHGAISIPHRAGFWQLFEIARRIRPLAEDLSVVFPHSFRAAWLAFLAHSQRRLGYARNGRAAFLTDAVPPYRENGKIVPVYMAKEYIDLVRVLGCEDDGVGLELHADKESVETVRERTAGRGPLVGIAPGAAFGPSKQWPVERYAAVADRLHDELGARCVLMTGPGEEHVRETLIQKTRSKLLIYDENRPSIRMLKALVSQLDLLICNDSGPRHVAVAFHVPVVCIMGPTSPVYSEGPYEIGKRLRIDVDCGPCQKPVCPTDHRCMTGISVDQVVTTAKTFLENLERKG